MGAGTGQPGSPLKPDELRPWAVVYMPNRLTLYEVLWVDEDDGKVGLLDVAQDLPDGEVEPSTVVGLKWAKTSGNLRLIRRAPRFAGEDSPSKVALAGTLR